MPAQQRKALGRGLSVLLGTPDIEIERFRELDIDQVVPNADQPRKSFDENALDDLAASIRTHGIVQPIVVRALEGGTFQIVAGERRWRAAQRAGLSRVPALVRESHEHQALELALVENVQRENLNPVDEARAYERLMSEFGLTQEEVASRVGKSRVSVSNSLRILRLPGEVLRWMEEGRLTAGHAKALLALPDATSIVEAAREILRGNYSVRQAEALAARQSRPRALSAETEDPNVRAAILALERVLGTKVRIEEARGKGKIEIHFHSREEMDRIYEGLIQSRF